MASVNNSAITFLPPVGGGIEDVVLSFYETKLSPEVFGECSKHLCFPSVKMSILWAVLVICESTVMFIIYFLVTSTDVFAEDGKVNGDDYMMMSIPT